MHIKYSKAFIKAYKRLDDRYKSLVKKGLDALQTFPDIDSDVKPIKGYDKGLYRLRVGKYRVVFSVGGDTVFIDKLDSRGDIYK